MTGAALAGPFLWDRVGSVPVVWHEAPGPLVAALGFRVGRADEPLAGGGLTHLVEHLAVSGLGDQLYDYDGFVNGTATWFGFRGAPGEAAGYFGSVCEALSALPLGRLDAEVNVVRAEEARRSLSVAGRSLLLRFGARGWGTYDLPQYGLNRLSPGAVAAWATRWFGAANAVLWSTGPSPPGLALDLAPGVPRPEPRAEPLPGNRLPGWTTHASPLVALSLLLPRSAAAAAVPAILRARLRRTLRDLDGTGYEVTLAVDHLDVATTHVLVTADGPPASVVETLNAVTGALASDGPTAAEVAHHLARRRRDLADPSLVPGRLAEAAAARLCGWGAPDPAHDLDETASTGPAGLARLFAKARASALLLVPVGTPVPPSLAVPLEGPEPAPLAGARLRPAGEAGDERRLVVGEEGASLFDGARWTTVRTTDAAAVLWWRDGARVLVGTDGAMVAIEPGRWRGAGRRLAGLDAAVPDGVRVPMGERAPWSAVAEPRRARRNEGG